MDMNVKADESPQIQKARKKLEKQMNAENKLINRKAIKKMKEAIQIWLKRHQGERVDLQERVSYAKTKSKFVTHLTEQLKNESKQTKEALKPLIGRIKQSGQAE